MFRMNGFFGSSNHKPYEGFIDVNSFNITRIIGYRNSFIPRIKGQIEKSINGTTIRIKMRLHPLVLAFMTFWLGGVTLAFFVFLSDSIGNETLEPVVFIPVVMFAFGYGLTTGAFKYESSKSKHFLTELLEGEIE